MNARSVTIILFLPGIAGTGVRAQCTGVIDLGPDTMICAGASLVLDAGPGLQSYLWEDGSTTQTHTVNAAGTYSCTSTDFGTSGELVSNGAFNAGLTGFTSDYVPGTGGPYGLLSYAGTYATTTSPSLVHSNFYPFGDHTTGTGPMLVVNGAEFPGQDVWCETLPVQPNTDYAFAAWLATAYPESPAQLVFTVNGDITGDPLLASFTPGQWLPFYSIWNSGANTTATICISNQNTFDSGNDFALDDISFAPFCTYADTITVAVQPFPLPDLGPDLSVCQGVPVPLDATWPGADGYAWQDGSTGAVLFPTATGIYWVDVTENGCTARDSVDVEIDPLPVVDLGPAQEHCAGDVVVLDAWVPGATYLWQDGSTASSFTATGSGTYAVAVDLNGCSDSSAVALQYHPLPVVDLGADTAICNGTVLDLDVDRPGGTYLWDDGSTAGTRQVVEAGTYSVRVTELGCSATDTLHLGIIPLPFVDLGHDFLLCTGTTAQLQAGGPGFSTLWSNGDTTVRYTVAQGGTVSATVSNGCGMMADTVLVTEDQCDCPVFVPNAFSPDNDGVNEGFGPRFDCPVTEYEFRVYDRWGGLVWSSNRPGEDWWPGAGVPSGVYAWMLHLRSLTAHEDASREWYGHVVLLR